MPRTVHLVGDSTAGPKSRAAAPETGWGMALPYYLDDTVAVANHARNGRSTRSFVAQGRLDAVARDLQPGDVLLVQFGHNDAKVEDPERHTEPWTSYTEHLGLYLDAARAAGARPVLATSVERRRFDDAGRAVPAHGDYPAAMRALAEREDVPVIDVQRESLALWDGLGPERTLHYFFHADDGRRDDTHFNPPGAAAVARIVAAGLVGAGVLEAADVRRLDEDVPDAWFRWLDGDPT
ncbi:rhamnogalacturonan acetylesterase [Krasilnikoviella flava]|uniref:Lysophospholipase L1 n=1 Tax=Krasilnikoviella flava TaxID=526729 RepID=A0A1T5KVL5_9MICO|nr:rhamnogalacturonan acetylesterase [Krasilnikoviella flava]SKC67515.1 Lysophospholipase L1 [Krasilnikoviella flava]